MADLATQAPATSADAKTDSGQTVILNKQFLVRTNERLPHLDRPDSVAFAAEDLQSSERPVFVLVCDPTVPVRSDLLTGMMRRACPNVVSPRMTGVIKLPGRNDRRMAIVFEKPGGMPVHDGLAQGGKTFTWQDIARTILPSVIEALDQLRLRGLTHRGVRLDNLYYADSSRTSVVLGECCSAPPGRHQPAVYEPLTSAAADPDARGEESIASDLYALGVTVLALVSGEDPAQGRDPATLLASKLALGSYGALVGAQRFDTALNALLVGLLLDDPERRWNLDRLKRWSEGLFDSSQRAASSRKAVRSFSFMDQEYFYPGLLAMALSRHPSEAVEVIGQGRVEKWFRNVLSDTGGADTVKDAALRFSGTGEKRVSAELVARVCLALDPEGPIRFDSISTTISGVGPALAQAFADDDRKRLKSISELFRSSLLLELSAMASGGAGRMLPVYVCTALQNYVRDRTGVGAGLERCLYELNTGLACQSALASNGCPISLTRLVSSLDRTAAADSMPIDALLDRHVAAFIASRDKSFEKYLLRVSRLEPDSPLRTLEVVSVFARLQKGLRMGPLHGLSAATARSLQPLIDRLKSTVRREILTRNLSRLVSTGDIGSILNGLNLHQAAKTDQREYVAAVAYFQALGERINILRSNGNYRLATSIQQGYWIATLLAVVGLTVSLSSTVFRIAA